MISLKEYLAYLKDNPERYWFKRKLYGWGWTPATWQGWTVILVYVLVLIAMTTRLDETMSTTAVLKEFVAPLAVLTIVLIAVSYATGETPRWQWGKRKDHNTSTPTRK